VVAIIVYYKDWKYITKIERILFFIATVSLPIAQIQTLGIFGQKSLFWVNYTEHLAIAFAFTFIIYPLLRKRLNHLTAIRKIMTITGIVIFIGLFYEIADFTFRFLVHDFIGKSAISYWYDTLKDMSMEIVGTTTAAFLLVFILPHFDTNKE
jgi:hypothetical protein